MLMSSCITSNLKETTLPIRLQLVKSQKHIVHLPDYILQEYRINKKSCSFKHQAQIIVNIIYALPAPLYIFLGAYVLKIYTLLKIIIINILCMIIFWNIFISDKQLMIAYIVQIAISFTPPGQLKKIKWNGGNMTTNLVRLAHHFFHNIF